MRIIMGRDGVQRPVAMPFVKFFNYGESNNAEIDWSHPVLVMDKGELGAVSPHSCLAVLLLGADWKRTTSSLPQTQSMAACPRSTDIKANGTSRRLAGLMVLGTGVKACTLNDSSHPRDASEPCTAQASLIRRGSCSGSCSGRFGNP